MVETLSDFLDHNAINRENVDNHRQRMLAEVRAYRLKELRSTAGLTQHELADRIGVSQRQVSKIEHGDLENTKIGTVRRYLEAVGGNLTLDVVFGETRIQIA
ncbi:MAG: helix-turn-helix domain-containing protein [Brevibacterium sp.]|uniref:helix-turn-helix domain-containing protein n=1 Tax=unclassified Brevibacterium TaxID=2614124 RepID=UPI001080CB42|nr:MULTISPECIES: helix-turn-helix transcriptional regulator [unclassified Brevibacterium]TGD11685.1 helix-turn-helix domain-containing protein [Brevibacterium sp. S111]TGD31939.1 helix-turn-helix domain-containing protein [Brevibacterium sp. S22]